MKDIIIKLKIYSLTGVISIAFLIGAISSYGQVTPVQKKITPMNTKPVNTNSTLATQASGQVVAFKTHATYIGGQAVKSAVPYDVDFNGHPLFDEGNNFSNDKDEFTVPSDGYYHFDVRVGWDKFSAKGDVQIRILINWYSGLPAVTYLPGNTDIAIFDTNFSTLLKLKTGDKVRLQLIQNSGASQTFKQVQFSGFKIN